jgi:sensor histidine kinase YesM
MKNNEKRILLYINTAYVLAIIPVVLLLLPIERLLEEKPASLLVFMLYIGLIYYMNRRFNIPALILKRRFMYAAVVLCSTVGITYLFDRFSINEPLDNKYESFPKLLEAMRSRTIWSLYIINMSFGLMTGLVVELYRQIIHRQSVESEKNKAEIALYKSQINPHFMFNTLNTLYGLFISQSGNAEDMFVKFTNILKYMYLNAARETIRFDEEISYIQEYIDLQSLRLGRHTKVELQCQIDDDKAVIAPMILITFVENCFKYGISSTTHSLISISIELQAGVLRFNSTNGIYNRNKQIASGIGIENCRKRLELLYPRRYSLLCEPSEQMFNVTLTIQL